MNEAETKNVRRYWIADDGEQHYICAPSMRDVFPLLMALDFSGADELTITEITEKKARATRIRCDDADATKTMVEWAQAEDPQNKGAYLGSSVW